MVAVLGLLIVGAVHLTIAGYIAVQSDRNEFLKRENVRLDKEIEEIKKLKTEIAALLARKQIIERLQADRAQAVYMLQELVQQVPDGVYLKAIKQTGLQMKMGGDPQSDGRVSTLVGNFGAAPYLEDPDPVGVKAAPAGNKGGSPLIMNLGLKPVPSH